MQSQCNHHDYIYYYNYYYYIYFNFFLLSLSLSPFLITMVLQDLGRKLTAAFQQLNAAPIVDEKVFTILSVVYCDYSYDYYINTTTTMKDPRRPIKRHLCSSLGGRRECSLSADASKEY